jgi:ribonuclease H / adenosylcobalamin/alpha-ribazole phosphatase
MRRRLVVEADGGSRGNPGPAAYGALVRDAETGEVLAEAAEPIGRATNNVAEYRGLIAGLRLVSEVDPAASVEVRMDSKLVVEQMAGRWKIKHADMRQLAMEARRFAPPDVLWTHVPRERNAAADRLLNKVLDGGPAVWSTAASGTTGSTSTPAHPSTSAATSAPSTSTSRAAGEPSDGRAADLGTPTTLLLLRHGETAHSVARTFSGSGGDDVPLTPNGRAQAEAAAAALADRTNIGVVASSPLRRARETAAAVAAVLGVPVRVEPGLAEADFGAWEGRTFAEVGDAWPDELTEWLASTSVAPPGGESLDVVGARVRAAVDPLLASYTGRGVVLVTHAAPVKALVCRALDVPLGTAFRMELPPGSLSEVHWYADGRASLRSFAVVPRPIPPVR